MPTPNPQTIYDFKAALIDGRELPLSDLKGKVLLTVNVASKCGFTPQYEGLEALYQKYKERGLEVLAFPCNQFGGQEPGGSEEILACSLTRYKASFPMFDKIEVNGPEAHPLFNFLKSSAKGLLGTEAVKWNFTKFLVDRTGKVHARYSSQTEPSELAPEIEALLK